MKMGFIADLHSTDAQLGGKARSLARLSALGLPTPSGFVVTDDLFRALCPSLRLPTRIDDAALTQLDRARADLLAASWPAGFSQELVRRLSELAPEGLWSVRSSFAAEDVAGGLGAGVYESVVAIRPDEVEQAIRRVLASALSAGAVAYALAHGVRPAAPPVSVLLHGYVRGEAEGSAACEPMHSDRPVIQVRAGTLAPSPAARLREALSALAQSEGAIEVEWVATGETVIFLQMRPYQPPPAPARWKGWADLEAGEPCAHWRWDQAHNPLPLSPAQAGLVALVDERCRIGIRQCVLGQYLFWAPDDRAGPKPIAPEEAPARFAALRAQVDSRLTVLGATPMLENALDLLLAVEEPIFGVIQPALRAARARLAELLRQAAPARLPALAQLLGGAESMASERRRRAAALRAAPGLESAARARAHYLEFFGDDTPVWDVAFPTYRETLERLERGETARQDEPASAAQAEQAARSVGDEITPGRREEWRRLLGLARQAVGLGEDDDWLYARVLAAVRRALVHLGTSLKQMGVLSEVDDVFFLPLDLARALAAGAPPPPDVRQQAAAGHAAWEAARQDPPPAQAVADAASVRGVGIGGRAVGRVLLHQPGKPRPAPGQVLVAPTLLPSELPLLVAAAWVTETGGLLDHVAAQAREQHLPAVVGAPGACQVFHDGDLVLVDADQGLVVRLG